MARKEVQKLKELHDQIDALIKEGATASSTSFKAWKLKVQRLLIKLYGQESYEASAFKKINFALYVITPSTPDYLWVEACREGLELSKSMLQEYIEELDSDEMKNNGAGVGLEKELDVREVFVVHGHDDALRESVARLLEQQGLKPVILMEQANEGMTVIEKFEKHSEVGAAICLFTGDDIILENGAASEFRQARQNVILETGYFIGRLGRERVVVVADNDVKMPSDLAGIVYVNRRSWKFEVLKELSVMGFQIDTNKLLNQ